MNQAINDCLAGLNSIGKAFCSYAAGAFLQSALLVILLFGIDLVLRKRVRAVFRYCVWLLVLVKLVLPPTLALPTGIGYWLGDRLPAASPVSERLADAVGFEGAGQHRSARSQPAAGVSQVQPPAPVVEPDAPVAPTALSLTPITWQVIFLLLWLAGVLAFAALLAQRVRFVKALVMASTPAEGELLGLLEQCRQQMGVRRQVGLRTSDTMPSPAVCGLLRPIVLMPASLVKELSREGLRATLTHELAHIKRGDLWVNSLQTFLQVVYFYNPFVWFANAVIRRTCEEAVDETVLVTLGGRAKDYSNTLIDIGEMAFWKADFGLRLVGVAESRKALQWRIKHMLTRPVPQSARIGALGTIMIVVVAAVLLPMARAEKANQEASATGPVTGVGVSENALNGAWYYHVKTGGTGGRPVQSEADPGLSSCWNSINAAFAAVKGHATPGPWIIQVDDEATYDEAVALTDLQTSSTETLTLTKAPWLAGRPTIYPSQPGKRALAINGLWRGVAISQPLPDQPGQPANRVTYVTVRGFTLKNNAQGTEKGPEQSIFSDHQRYLTEGLHIIEECCFDGQSQIYDSMLPIFVYGTCINTVFRRNVFRDLRRNEDSMKEGRDRDLFATTPPVSTVVGQPQVTVADNTFFGNRGTVFVGVGDAVNQRYYRLVFERNTLRANYSYSRLAYIGQNPLSNIVRNNIFSDNAGGGSVSATLTIVNASNTKVYHNTFFNNHGPQEVAVDTGSTEGVEIKNNIFWPTPASYCIGVARGCTENLVCANNALFTDFQKDGYPPGFGFSTTENTETVGLWNGKPMTTDGWNQASKNNMGNGYTLEGPGLDKNMHLVADSTCIDRGISGLAADDFDGKQRPVGAGCDIGADEYGTTGTTRSLAGEYEPQLEGQQLALDTPICLAAYMGDMAKMERCLQEGVDINKLDGRGYAPLHYAAQNDQKQAIELLVAKGGDINVRDPRGQTPLVCAIVSGHRDLAELLIAKGAEVSLHAAVRLSDAERVRSCLEKGADVNTKDAAGLTPLHVAVNNKRRDVAELLISKRADLDARDKDGSTPLVLALDSRQRDMADLLISAGADLNASDGDGYTPLYHAIWANDANMVEVLVGKGADVNLTPEKGYPLLQCAIWEEDMSTVRFLVDHGARFDVEPQGGWSAFRYAVCAGSRDLIELFVAKGARVSNLHWAAWMGNLAQVRSAVEQGADVVAKDGELGWTPLHWAASGGQEEVAAFLIDKGAEVDARDERGNTPLVSAAAAGRRAVTELLIAKGADVNAKAADGWTPLHAAAFAGYSGLGFGFRENKEVIEILIAKGADVNAKNKEDQTPLPYAIVRQQGEIVELLRKHGAKE